MLANYSPPFYSILRMLKVVHFYYIFVLLIITQVIIAEEKDCEKIISDVDACNQQRADEIEFFRCAYQALGLMGEDGQYIKPLTEHEEILIPHAKSFEECWKQNGEVVMKTDNEDPSEYSYPCEPVFEALRKSYVDAYNCELPK